MNALEQKREAARIKAFRALAGYKFIMFGYWAAVWVHLNQCCPAKQSSPFRDIVMAARKAVQ